MIHVRAEITNLVRAGLEGSGIASSSRVKRVDAGQDRVGVQAGTDDRSAVDVGGGIELGRVPVALEEAQCVCGLGSVRRCTGRVAERSRECGTFTERTVLNGSSEER
jgi:hypothetical protein